MPQPKQLRPETVVTTDSEMPANKSSERLTLKFVLDELSELIMLEKGSLFTTRELLLRPGKTIRQYLNGNRSRLTSPLKYLLMTVAMVVFGYHIVLPLIGHNFGLPSTDPSLEILQPHIDQLNEAAQDDSLSRDVKSRLQLGIEALNTPSQKRMMDLTLSWMNVSLILAVPVFAALTWLVIRREMFFVEHFVAHAYIYGIQCVLAFLLTPLMFSPHLSISFGVYTVSSAVYQLFAWKQLFYLRTIKDWMIAVALLVGSLVIYLIGVTAMSIVMLFVGNAVGALP